MGQRMFVAIVPPQPIRDELEEFLSFRPQMRWISPEQWHVTLAFMENVPQRCEDELLERLQYGFSRKSAFHMQLVGGGCFPDPSRAKVLWVRPVVEGDQLAALALTARSAAVKAGVRADGRRFVPHVSVARLRRPLAAIQWLRILDSFTSSTWEVDAVELIASYLKEGPAGRPRYETVGVLPLGEGL